MNLIPRPEEFFLQVPLYRTYKINEIDLNEVYKIIFYTDTKAAKLYKDAKVYVDGLKATD